MYDFKIVDKEGKEYEVEYNMRTENFGIGEYKTDYDGAFGLLISILQIGLGFSEQHALDKIDSEIINWLKYKNER